MELLESLLWRPGEGYFLLDRHVRRLARSALVLGYACSESVVQSRLEIHARRLTSPCKVRLTLSQEGEIVLSEVGLEVGAGTLQEPLRVGIARTRVPPGEPLLQHKTTERALYRAALASRPDCDDVLLVNERGEITEASSSNVVFEREGRRWTPPTSCGLLPGTFREHLLDMHEIAERVLRVRELAGCDALFLINSVRTWRRATLMDVEP